MTQKSKPKLRIGVVGCGNISLAYMRNAPLFRDVEITACADLNREAAKRRAEEFGLRATDADSLLEDKEVDLVLNLTIPAAHFDISMRALSAGKHVFTEKPLGVNADEGRKLVDAADARGLAIGSAPDTFLGAAGRHARRLMESGITGKPVTGTAFVKSPCPMRRKPADSSRSERTIWRLTCNAISVTARVRAMRTTMRISAAKF